MNLHLELSQRVKVLPLFALLLNFLNLNLLPLLLLMAVNLLALKLVEMHLS